MKVAIIGYGKMGKEIEKILESKNHEIIARINQDQAHQLDELIQGADVAIEFTVPSSAKTNIEVCLDAGIPIVIGTTGWYNHFDELVNKCKSLNGAMFHATNFSVGVNIFFKLNTWLASVMNRHLDYQASIQEVHHIHKLDSPSGTGITTAEGLIEKHSEYHSWKETDGKNADKGILPIKSERRGEVPGIHKVIYENEVDTISIAHSAKSRAGFALGAVLAAEYINGKSGVFTMNDLLELN